MRKVTQEIAAAFKLKVNRAIGNTMTDGNAIYLHGNKIAWRNEDGKLTIDSCGWNSRTTRERLNGIAGVSVNTWGGKPIVVS